MQSSTRQHGFSQWSVLWSNCGGLACPQLHTTAPPYLMGVVLEVLLVSVPVSLISTTFGKILSW